MIVSVPGLRRAGRGTQRCVCLGTGTPAPQCSRQALRARPPSSGPRSMRHIASWRMAMSKVIALNLDNKVGTSPCCQHRCRRFRAGLLAFQRRCRRFGVGLLAIYIYGFMGSSTPNAQPKSWLFGCSTSNAHTRPWLLGSPTPNDRSKPLLLRSSTPNARTKAWFLGSLTPNALQNREFLLIPHAKMMQLVAMPSFQREFAEEASTC